MRNSKPHVKYKSTEIYTFQYSLSSKTDVQNSNVLNFFYILDLATCVGFSVVAYPYLTPSSRLANSDYKNRMQVGIESILSAFFLFFSSLIQDHVML